MAELSFQNRLQFFGSRLSKSEQKIAAYIVAHPEEAVSVASQELAQSIGTSNSTLTRFCKKLDYRNYIEFQTLLAAERTPDRTPDQIIHARTLDAACELVRPESVDAFVERIHQAEKILVFGLGSSGLTASEFNMRLVQMGFTSSVMTDTFLMRVQSSLFSPRDLIIAVSNSGETPEVVSACRIAKSAGVQICLLTQNPRSTLGQMADTILLAGDIGQVGDEKFINSQMPLVFLIDTITYRLLEDPKCRESRDRALQTLFHRSF